MTRLIRRIAGPFWSATGPVRRALMGRFDARVVRIVSGTIERRMVPPILDALRASEARLERIEGSIVRADRSASTVAEEVDLVLNGLSREIFRLRAQVEQLRRDAGEGRPPVAGLSILAESDHEPREVPPAERSRVG